MTQYPAPGSPPWYPPPQSPPKKSRTGLIVGIVAVVVVLPLLLIGACTLFTGGALIGSMSSETTAADESEAPDEPSDSPKKQASPEEKTGAANTIAEGDFEVGTDVKAGTYITTVPEDSVNCYWERGKGDPGDIDDIIANDNLNPGAHGRVTLKKGEIFSTNGCGIWRLK